MMQEKHLTYLHTGAYATLNELTPLTKRVWIVFHGYGQLAKFFIRKFYLLNPADNYIIAPQGINKHYLQGFEGRVGANWMTKEDRLTDIANQYAYLDAVLANEAINWEKVDLVYLGFSQGVTTMARYAAYSRRDFAKMIFWAGPFPSELHTEDFNFRKGSERYHFFAGADDPLFDSEQRKDQLLLLQQVFQRAIPPKIFDGIHELKSELIAEL